MLDPDPDPDLMVDSALMQDQDLDQALMVDLALIPDQDPCLALSQTILKIVLCLDHSTDLLKTILETLNHKQILMNSLKVVH